MRWIECLFFLLFQEKRGRKEERGKKGEEGRRSGKKKKESERREKSGSQEIIARFSLAAQTRKLTSRPNFCQLLSQGKKLLASLNFIKLVWSTYFVSLFLWKASCLWDEVQIQVNIQGRICTQRNIQLPNSNKPTHARYIKPYVWSNPSVSLSITRGEIGSRTLSFLLFASLDLIWTLNVTDILLLPRQYLLSVCPSVCLFVCLSAARRVISWQRRWRKGEWGDSLADSEVS